MNTAPYVVGSQTSKAAALSIASHLSPMRAKVFEAILNNPRGEGATCDEIEMLTGLKHQSASPRLRELEKLGLVRESGKTRKTSTNHEAIVWEWTGVFPDSVQLSIFGGKPSKKTPTKSQKKQAAARLRATFNTLGADPNILSVVEWLES